MILKWRTFNESSNQETITRDIVQEVMFFDNFTIWPGRYALQAKSGLEADLQIKLVELRGMLDEVDLPSSIDNIDKIYEYLKKDTRHIGDVLFHKLRDTFLEIFNLIVSTVMIEFPRFYEIEDCLLSYLDNGYEIEHEFKLKRIGGKDVFNIIIKGYIDIKDYSKLVNNSTQIINRLKNYTKKEIIVSDSEYINKGESQLKITIQ